MTEFQTRRVCCFDGKVSDQCDYLACSCGYPVWCMETKAYWAASKRVEQSAALWRRQEKLKAAGGKHSRKELQEISVLQGGRCIYCDAPFNETNRPSEDHLLPVTQGGTDWAMNIVLACRRCNSRRGNIPFRTFCKLLSPTQNKRILTHIGKRLMALDEEHRSRFVKGLAPHDPKHSRYLCTLTIRATARRNAKINRLLPGTAIAILRKAAMVLRQSRIAVELEKCGH